MIKRIPFLCVAVVITFVIFSACQHSKKKTETSEKEVISLGGSWAGSMHSLRGSIQNLTPYIYNTKEFESPENETFLKKEIHNLAVEASRINHDPQLISRDPTVNFVSVSFKEDVDRSEQAFLEGKKSFSRYQLMRLTSYCVDCHTRTQQGKEFNFGQYNPFPANMAAENKIEIHIASRNFKKAYAEALLDIKLEASPQNLERVSILGLQVAVQYEEDLDKAQELVSALESSDNVPYYLKLKALKWKKSLSDWKEEDKPRRGLRLARYLLKKKDKSEIEAMRALRAVLPQLTISISKEELGEALFLAGSSYELLEESSGSYLNESYYESCILRVPHSTWAEACYKNLANSITIGYSGSSGIHIPLSVQVKLDKLKELSQIKK